MNTAAFPRKHWAAVWPWPCILWRCKGCPSPPRSHPATAPGCCASAACRHEEKRKRLGWERLGWIWALELILRHDWGLGDESLRCRIIFDTFDCHSGPPVVSQYHIYEGLKCFTCFTFLVQCKLKGKQKKQPCCNICFSPPNSPLPMVWRSFSSFLFKAQPPGTRGGTHVNVFKRDPPAFHVVVSTCS